MMVKMHAVQCMFRLFWRGTPPLLRVSQKDCLFDRGALFVLRVICRIRYMVQVDYERYLTTVGSISNVALQYVCSSISTAGYRAVGPVLLFRLPSASREIAFCHVASFGHMLCNPVLLSAGIHASTLSLHLQKNLGALKVFQCSVH